VRVEGKEEHEGNYAMGDKRKRVVRWGEGMGDGREEAGKNPPDHPDAQTSCINNRRLTTSKLIMVSNNH
jgi:hypothetical protein